MSYNQRNRIFKVLYKRYFNKVRLRVMRILYNEKDVAEDIAQEAFMRAYMYLDKIYRKDEFLKWVYTVSRNLSYNYRRDKKYSINSSLKKLAPNYRAAVQLCGINGLTYDDAAIALNTSVSVVAHNLMRAKRELSCIIG